jgi:hypothetical protein
MFKEALELDAAVQWLERAHAAGPQDSVVLSHLASALAR